MRSGIRSNRSRRFQSVDQKVGGRASRIALTSRTAARLLPWLQCRRPVGQDRQPGGLLPLGIEEQEPLTVCGNGILVVYRTMEALRNHVQHRSLPISSISYPTQRINRGTDGWRTQHTVSVSLDVQRVRDQGGFKPSVLSELQSIGRLVPLTPLVRLYLDCFVRVHDALRKQLLAAAELAEQRMKATAARGAEAFGGQNHGLVVVRATSEGEWRDSEDIFGSIAERWRELRSKNVLLGSLSGLFVSGEAEPINFTGGTL